jgi:hypothetical protein
MRTDHIIYGEYARPAFELTAPPIFIPTVNDLDDISLLKGKFARLGGLEGMQCADASNNWDAVHGR